MQVFALTLLMVCTPTAILDLALPKWRADRNVRIEDAYKWIYQATRGGEHAAPNHKMARQWLENEWSSLGQPDAREKLWQPLCKDESIGRLDLRVFKAKGGKIDDVLAAFLTSSREYNDTGSSFLDAWSAFGERLKRHPVGSISSEDWSRLDAEMRVQNYPASHHSRTFESAEHPAYRVITKAEKTGLIQRLK